MKRAGCWRRFFLLLRCCVGAPEHQASRGHLLIKHGGLISARGGGAGGESSSCTPLERNRSLSFRCTSSPRAALSAGFQRLSSALLHFVFAVVCNSPPVLCNASLWVPQRAVSHLFTHTHIYIYIFSLPFLSYLNVWMSEGVMQL